MQHVYWGGDINGREGAVAMHNSLESGDTHQTGHLDQRVRMGERMEKERCGPDQRQS